MGSSLSDRAKRIPSCSGCTDGTVPVPTMTQEDRFDTTVGDGYTIITLLPTRDGAAVRDPSPDLLPAGLSDLEHQIQSHNLAACAEVPMRTLAAAPCQIPPATGVPAAQESMEALDFRRHSVHR